MTIIYLNIAGTEMIEICLSPKGKQNATTTYNKHISAEKKRQQYINRCLLLEQNATS